MHSITRSLSHVSNNGNIAKMNLILFLLAPLIALAAGSVTITKDATIVVSVVVTSSSVVFIPLHTTTYTALGTARAWTIPDFTRTDTTVYT